MRISTRRRARRAIYAGIVMALVGATACGELTAPMPSPESCDLISGAQDSAWGCN